MREDKIKKRDLKFFIFSVIGIFNTLFDLALYVVFDNLTRSIIVANIIATSAAIIGSYLLNSRITFKAKKWTKKSFISFIAVTLFGLWVLQTGLIIVLSPLVRNIPEHIWLAFGPIEHIAKTVLPKLIATSVTFVWNFVWYNKVIFKKDNKSAEELLRIAEL